MFYLVSGALDTIVDEFVSFGAAWPKEPARHGVARRTTAIRSFATAEIFASLSRRYMNPLTKGVPADLISPRKVNNRGHSPNI